MKVDLNTLAKLLSRELEFERPKPHVSRWLLSGSGIDARMTGTYRLNTSRSDNVANVINNSLGRNSNDQRAGVRRNLEGVLHRPR